MTSLKLYGILNNVESSVENYKYKLTLEVK